jgi:Fe-S-cluster containining protein
MTTWYKGGLRFECTQCGNCCTGAPGYVWVTVQEIYRIAEFLGMRHRDFIRQFVRKANGKMSLIELPNGNCIFYEKGCKIYPVRPTQCRTFPFWKEIVASESSWNRAAAECPGIQQGKTFSDEEIDTFLRENP